MEQQQSGSSNGQCSRTSDRSISRTCNIIYTITGGCGGTVSAQQTVTINPNAGITSVTGTTPLCIGGTATYTANGVVLSGGTGAWSSSNPAVATVSAAGLVTGVSAGTCNIIYTITGGCGGTVSAQQCSDNKSECQHHLGDRTNSIMYWRNSNLYCQRSCSRAEAQEHGAAVTLQ